MVFLVRIIYRRLIKFFKLLYEMQKRHYQKYGYFSYIMILIFTFCTFWLLATFGSWITEYWTLKCLYIDANTTNRTNLRLHFKSDHLSPKTIELIRKTSFVDVLSFDFRPTSKIRWYDSNTVLSNANSEWTSICQSFNEEAVKKGSSLRLTNELNFQNLDKLETREEVYKKMQVQIDAFNQRRK